MNNNINQKLEEVLKKLNPNDIKTLASSPAIQGILKNLNASDKEKLIREFSALNTSEIQKKLSSLNVNSLRGLNADEIIKKLKNL